MIKDLLYSLTDNFKEKVKNPFLSTYLIIWCIRNWEAIYSLFNFDNDFDLEMRISCLRNYFNKEDFINGLGINIVWTFVVLIVTYTLLNVSRFIVNMFERRLKPWIYKVSDRSSIVLKSEHERIKNQFHSSQTKLQKALDYRIELEKDKDDLEKELKQQWQSHEDDISRLVDENRLEVNKLKGKHEKDLEKLKSEHYRNQKIISLKYYMGSDTVNEFGEDVVLQMVDILPKIRNGLMLKQTEPGLKAMKEKGLIEINPKGNNDISSKTYRLTEKGETVFNRVNSNLDSISKKD